jgi:hypothetical protein
LRPAGVDRGDEAFEQQQDAGELALADAAPLPVLTERALGSFRFSQEAVDRLAKPLRKSRRGAAHASTTGASSRSMTSSRVPSATTLGVV